MALFGARCLEDHPSAPATRRITALQPPRGEDLRRKHGVQRPYAGLKLGRGGGRRHRRRPAHGLHRPGPPWHRPAHRAAGGQTAPTWRRARRAVRRSSSCATRRDTSGSARAGAAERAGRAAAGALAHRAVLTRSSVPLAGRRVSWPSSSARSTRPSAVAGRWSAWSASRAWARRASAWSCASSAASATWCWHSALPAHAQSVPLLPVLELIRSLCDVHGDDGQAVIRRRSGGAARPAARLRRDAALRLRHPRRADPATRCTPPSGAERRAGRPAPPRGAAQSAAAPLRSSSTTAVHGRPRRQPAGQMIDAWTDAHADAVNFRPGTAPLDGRPPLPE